MHPFVFGGDWVHRRAPLNNAQDAVIFTRSGAQIQFLWQNRLARGVNIRGLDPGVRARWQGDFGPLRGFTGLVFIQIDLAHNRHCVALFQMGNDLALEPGLAAGINVGGHFRRTGNQRHRRFGDGLGGRGGLVLLMFDGYRVGGRLHRRRRGAGRRRNRRGRRGDGRQRVWIVCIVLRNRARRDHRAQDQPAIHFHIS